MRLGQYQTTRETEAAPRGIEECCHWLEEQPDETFLLPDLLASDIHLSELEVYLNANYSLEENLHLRGKIVGRQAPRDAYQVYFPIGSSKLLPGPHVVCGHASPDMDTTIASFWSFLDAFAARVGEGPTLWHLPGGEMPGQARELLIGFLGEGVTQLVVSDLPEQATVSLRDFCNYEEAGLGEGHEVVSVVDHHRATLQTRAQATVLLADVQSCNVLLAEQLHLLPTRHPERAIAENLCYLHAILDDTDLLARVTSRDVLSVQRLLAQLKQLVRGETSTLTFNDLPRSPRFAHLAARRLLEDPDLHSLYNRICAEREEQCQRDLELCLAGKPSNVFVDTKEQKQIARVGQTKIFANQFPWFAKHADAFRRAWLDRTTHFYERKPHLKLHLQMISTLLSDGEDEASDELWIWVPTTQAGFERLERYLAGFSGSLPVKHHCTGVDLFAPTPETEKLFARYFGAQNLRVEGASDLEKPVAVLRFAPGKLTSRKTCISPYL